MSHDLLNSSFLTNVGQQKNNTGMLIIINGSRREMEMLWLFVFIRPNLLESVNLWALQLLGSVQKTTDLNPRYTQSLFSNFELLIYPKRRAFWTPSCLTKFASQYSSGTHWFHKKPSKESKTVKISCGIFNSHLGPISS